MERKPKFKVGDRIYFKTVGNYGEEKIDGPTIIIEIVCKYDKYQYWNNFHSSRETYVAEDEAISAEVIESPLYKALQEE